jgi:ribosome-associated translation inhibitor RaiA
MEEIQYIGLDQCSDTEKQLLDKLSAEYYDKFQRTLQNITSLQIHIKCHDTEGQRKRFEITSRIVAPTKTIESHTEDWDFARTLHKVFKDLERQLEHKKIE